MSLTLIKIQITGIHTLLKTCHITKSILLIIQNTYAPHNNVDPLLWREQEHAAPLMDQLQEK